MKLFITVEIEDKDYSKHKVTFAKVDAVVKFALTTMQLIPTSMRITNMERRK